MATDPRDAAAAAAAAAAQAAAAAAQAAADTAAAATDGEALTITGRTEAAIDASPTLAVGATHLGDDALPALEDQLPSEQVSSMTGRELPEAGGFAGAGMLDLPQLGQLAADLGAYGAAVSGGFDTDLTFTDPGGGFDRSSISDAGSMPDSSWDRRQSTQTIWEPDGHGGGSKAQETTITYQYVGPSGFETPRTVTSVSNLTTGVRTVTTSDSDGTRQVEHFDAEGNRISDEDWNRPDPASDDNDPVLTTGITAQDVTNYIDGIFGGTDSSSTEDGTEGGAGTATAKMPVPDVDGSGGGYSPPPGGIDLGAVLTGLTGHTAGAGRSPLGPQGGDGAVNPGSEGTMYEAGRQTSLRDAKEWYGGGVSQPSPVDDPVAADPSMLQQPSLVDPDAVNPGTDDADTADDGAQASTAYWAPDGGAGAMAGGDAEPLAADTMAGGGLDGPGRAGLGDDGAGHGRGDHGRGFGQGQGHAGNHGRDEDDLPE